MKMTLVAALVQRAKSVLVATLLASLISPTLAQAATPELPLTINWYHGEAFLRPVIDVFTQETGIVVEVTSAYDRFDTDVMLVSDYKSLTEGKKLGHFQPLLSTAVERAVPARWRDRDGYWTGVVLRARAPIYNKAAVAGADVPRTWLDLADPKWKGKLTLRGGNNVYNRSLVAWMIHHYGEAATTRWARGLVANRSTTSEWRGDTGNAALVGNGDFAISLINTYYLGYMRTGGEWAENPAVVNGVGIAWLDGGGRGAIGQQVNVTGAAINKRSERDVDARRLIEWLVSPKGQKLLSEHVFKYPVRPDVPASAYLQSLGSFRADTTDLNDLELLYDRADRLMRNVGWKQTW